MVKRYLSSLFAPASAALALMGLMGLALSPTPAARGDDTVEMPGASLPFAGLTVLPDDQVRQIGANLGDYDFGRASVLDRPRVEHAFTLRNTGNASLTLTQLSPSCHCTNARLQEATGSVSPAPDGTLPTLAPGQQVTVKMTVELIGHPAGSFYQAVFIYAKGYDNPIAEIKASGTLYPLFSLSPTVLDFGQIAAHATKSLTLTATYDARLAPGGALPPLVASMPSIKIAPVGNVEPAPGSPGDGPLILVRHFTVTLRDATPGSINGSVSFAPAPAPTGRAGTPFDDIAATAYSRTGLPITGVVAAKAMPSSAGKVVRTPSGRPTHR